MSKTPTTWTTPPVEPVAWYPSGSGTVSTAFEGVIRRLQDGTQRIEQNSTVRTLQPNIITGKIPASWTEDAE